MLRKRGEYIHTMRKTKENYSKNCFYLDISLNGLGKPRKSEPRELVPRLRFKR